MKIKYLIVLPLLMASSAFAGWLTMFALDLNVLRPVETTIRTRQVWCKATAESCSAVTFLTRLEGRAFRRES